MMDFKKLGLYAMAACLTFSLAACSEDEAGPAPADHSTPSGPTNFTPEEFAEKAAKYEVKSAGSDYESFEFLADGTYIITRAGATSYTQKKAKPAVRIGSKKDIARIFKKAARAGRAETDNGYYIYGHYTVGSDGAYELEDGGKVIVSDDATVITFTLHGITSTVNVQKTQQVAAGENTTKLCRTWVCERMDEYVYYDNLLAWKINFNAETREFEDYYFHPYVREEGETDEELLQTLGGEIFYDLAPVTITFTTSGTYFVTYANGLKGVSTWKWSNEAQGTIFYDWEEDMDDDDTGYCGITFNDKKAYVKEDYSGYDGDDDDDDYDDGYYDEYEDYDDDDDDYEGGGYASYRFVLITTLRAQ